MRADPPPRGEGEEAAHTQSFIFKQPDVIARSESDEAVQGQSK